ncbi:MAG: hypothetical protein M3285_04495 [Actinomycetota bacterium]|nr:hypothetical protein [Actinomycetota bacterium]
MRRLVLLSAIGYLGLAILGLVKENRGELTCDCAEGCWCKRPPLALFRWVFPVGHALRSNT